MPEPITPPAVPEKASCCPALHLSAAFLVLRLFMGMRLVTSAFEKMGFFVAKGDATWGEALTLKKWFGESGLGSMVENADGTSEVLNQGFGDGKMWPIANAMLSNTKLPAELIKAFLIPLPYLMLVSGVLILLGLFNRFGWFLSCVVWFSLAFGQMLLPDEQTISYLSVYLIISALALALADHNRLRCTRF